MDTLFYKPDWAETKRRWSAFWAGERLDRPCMIVTAPRSGGKPMPNPPDDPVRRWTDVDYLIARNESLHSSTWYLGEAVPCGETFMVGWCAAYGAPIEFRQDTIWVGKRFDSWEQAPDFERDWDDEGWHLVKRVVAQVAAQARGRYMAGLPPLLVPNDLLASLRGTDDFLMDLLEQPELVEQALAAMRGSYIRMFEEMEDLLECRSLGYGIWWPFWSPDRLYVPQSDISCMLSPPMFERFIVPELEALCRCWKNVFYHLDGPGALQHLDRVLQMDGISGIEWVPGDGQPEEWPAWRWVFERIAASVKRVSIRCRPAHVREIIPVFSPERLLLSLRASSREEGEDLLEATAQWTSTCWPSTPS